MSLGAFDESSSSPLDAEELMFLPDIFSLLFLERGLGFINWTIIVL